MTNPIIKVVNQPKEQTLPSHTFDTSFATANRDIQSNISTIYRCMAAWGVDLYAAQTNTWTDPQQKISELHTACTMLFLQWQNARDCKDKALELAVSRVFNGLTKMARAIHEVYQIFDTAHLVELEASLKAELEIERDTHAINLEAIATALLKAAAARTHDSAWAWVVLPTFPRQHYGRILLLKVETADLRYPIFVTQPFFLTGEATQFHTHGQNWAFATPLGARHESCCPNPTHINTLWLPHSREQAFPLRLLDKTYYGPGTAAVIPPKVIHGISGARGPEYDFHLENLTRDAALRQCPIEHLRFGEIACLHIYRPDLPLSQALTESPFVRTQDRFFTENEMIVFDHWTQTIWSGCGGAWTKRMIQHGPTGDPCATCYAEADHRQENLDPRQVYDWLIQDPPPALVTFSASNLERTR